MERTPKGSLKEGSLNEPLKLLSSIYQRTLLGFLKDEGDEERFGVL